MAGRGQSKARRFAMAVTGHRLNQLPVETHTPLAAALDYVMVSAWAAAQEAFETPVTPVLVSSLAEGADRFAAVAALRRRWRLESPLPFQPDRYEEDFPEATSKAAFRGLLARAKRVEVAAEAAEPGAAPYAGAGRLAVAWSDLIIAVWNGAPPKGPGGTAEVAAQMADRGGPVIWIPSQTAGPLQVITSGGTSLDAALARRFSVCERPSAMRRA